MNHYSVLAMFLGVFNAAMAIISDEKMLYAFFISSQMWIMVAFIIVYFENEK